MPAKKQKKRDDTPSVYNPDFKYKPAGTAMDLAAKFKRIQREQAKAAKANKVRRVK
jgi:hypothetical protein